MKNYKELLWDHLERYAARRLGVLEKGTYKHRGKDLEYGHILPRRLWRLNFLEAFRAEIGEYLDAHPSIKRHTLFHHLSSSQAFAFNLFLPFFVELGLSARVLSRTLGIDRAVREWEFEHINDAAEGTNVDVMWRTDDGVQVFCEVKLSEDKFASTEADDDHLSKLEQIYRPRLKGAISDGLLDEAEFFENYQLLRNISLLGQDNFLVILLPKENGSLQPSLNKVLAGIKPEPRSRIKVAYIEDCLTALSMDQELSPELCVYASQLAEKYIVTNR